MPLQSVVPSKQSGWLGRGWAATSCFAWGRLHFSLTVIPSSKSTPSAIVYSASWDQYPQPLCCLGQKHCLFPSLQKPLNILVVLSPRQILNLSASPPFSPGPPLVQGTSITTASSLVSLESLTPNPSVFSKMQRGSSQLPASKSNPPSGSPPQTEENLDFMT